MKTYQIKKMLEQVLEAVDRDFDYWIKKNHEYGIGEEFWNERVFDWCLRAWGRKNLDPRYQLEFVLFRSEIGNGFKIHRDKGSGKQVILIMLEGWLRFVYEGEEKQIKAGEAVCFEGNKLHGVLKGSKGKYLVLFSGKLKK